MLKSFATMIGQAIFAALLAYLRDPENRDEIEKASGFAVDKITDAIPGQWDDRLADAITDTIAGKLPDLGPLNDVVAQLQPALKNLPFGLGGFLGGPKP